MPYWTAHLQPNHTRLALTLLRQSGFSVYYPLIPGKRPSTPVALFPNYAFVLAIEQWSGAHRCPGVRRLIINGERPAVIGDNIVDEIRRHEGRDGLIKLPKARGLQRGDRVKVIRGPFEGKLGVLHADMDSRQRVNILLAVLGGERRVLLPKDAVRAVC
jgi:transcription antitermination factor NusG